MSGHRPFKDLVQKIDDSPECRERKAQLKREYDTAIKRYERADTYLELVRG